MNLFSFLMIFVLYCFDLYPQRVLEITISNIRLQMDESKQQYSKDRKISVKSNCLASKIAE